VAQLATRLAYAREMRSQAKTNEGMGETAAGLVCPACATGVSARAARCPACGTAITGMASTHVDQTAADFGADQVDSTLSGPGDTDGGVPWAPSEAPVNPERTAAKRQRDPAAREGAEHEYLSARSRSK
jgi:hypothetical protein